MRIRKDQSGFAALELVLVVVVLAGIVVAGWLVYKNRSANNYTPSIASTSDQSQSPVVSNVSKAPPVKTAGDLDQAIKVLDQNDPSAANSGDSSQLGSQANF